MKWLAVVGLLAAACGGARHQSHLLSPDGSTALPVGILRGQISYADGARLPITANVTRDTFGGNTILVAKEDSIGVTVEIGWDGSLALDPGMYYYAMSGGVVNRSDRGLWVEYLYPDSRQPQNIVDAMPTSATLLIEHATLPHVIGDIDAQTDNARLTGTFDVTLAPLF